MLNHALVDTYPHLNTQSATAAPSPDIREYESTHDEVQKAIRKLKNAAEPDSIPPELPKYAEEPVSRVLHELFHKVWTTGRVPIERKVGVIVYCTSERAREINAPVTGLYTSCRFRGKYSPTFC